MNKFFASLILLLVLFNSSCIKKPDLVLPKATWQLVLQKEAENRNKLVWPSITTTDFVKYKLYQIYTDTTKYILHNPIDAKLIFESAFKTDTTFVDTIFRTLLTNNYLLAIELKGRTFYSNIVSNSNSYWFSESFFKVKNLANDTKAVCLYKTDLDFALATVDLNSHKIIARSPAKNTIFNYFVYPNNSETYVAMQTAKNVLDIYNSSNYSLINSISLPSNTEITNLTYNSNSILVSAKTTDSAIAYAYGLNNLICTDSMKFLPSVIAYLSVSGDSAYAVDNFKLQKIPFSSQGKFASVGNIANYNNFNITNQHVKILKNGLSFFCGPNYIFFRNLDQDINGLSFSVNASSTIIINDLETLVIHANRKIFIGKKRNFPFNYFSDINASLNIPIANNIMPCFSNNYLVTFCTGVVQANQVDTSVGTFLFTQDISKLQ